MFTVRHSNKDIFVSDMDGDDDGNGWKYGLSFICLGIVCVMSMGVFSLVYHAKYRGKNSYANMMNCASLNLFTSCLNWNQEP